MTDESKHINPRFDSSENPPEAFPRAHIDWGKSKDEIWAELERKMDAAEPPKVRVLFSPWMKIAMAAAFALLVGISAVMQFHKKSVEIPTGQHSSILLPDGSQVRLNAQSTLSYKPLLWLFSRKVNLEGEAFFEVKPGKKFEVASTLGNTIVLGTSFNIYSRNNNYQVTCVTGKVRVIENKGNVKVDILPGQKAAINQQGILDVHTGINTKQTISWLDNKLSFTSVPLQQVFEEIGRQYGIFIQIPKDLENTYTGTFKRDSSVEQALNLVCKPFDLKFTRHSNDEYIIIRNN
jgi:ferric-dicitrate binding protein FerR (iron transport regulator)